MQKGDTFFMCLLMIIVPTKGRGLLNGHGFAFKLETLRLNKFYTLTKSYLVWNMHREDILLTKEYAWIWILIKYYFDLLIISFFEIITKPLVDKADLNKIRLVLI